MLSLLHLAQLVPVVYTRIYTKGTFRMAGKSYMERVLEYYDYYR